jgi:hypothetical protein
MIGKKIKTKKKYIFQLITNQILNDKIKKINKKENAIVMDKKKKSKIDLVSLAREDPKILGL